MKAATRFSMSSLLPLVVASPRARGVSVVPGDRQYEQPLDRRSAFRVAGKKNDEKGKERKVGRQEQTIPGATELMRRLGQSLAQALVMPSTACLDVQYAARLGMPRMAAPLLMLTTTPAGNVLFDPGISPSEVRASWPAILRMASVPMFHVPVTLTAMIFEKSSSEMSFSSAGQIPAQFTRPSSRPGIEPMKFWHATRDVMSQLPVKCTFSSPDRSDGSFMLMSAMYTVAPLAASAFTVARPIPEAPPCRYPKASY